MERECGYKCGDKTRNHGHYTVIVRERTGKLLGRLTSDGRTTDRKLFAAVMSKARATEVAEDIMARHQDLTATVRPF